MRILGFLGSPRVNGLGSKLLEQALAGAQSRGAETGRYDLINCDIKFCRSCFVCAHTQPGLPIGQCPLEDDMASILADYVSADGYLLVTPNYDGSVTALMKRFLERKIALTYRPKEAYATIGSPRSPADFKKVASMIVTANCADEYREVMGDPCFEMLEGHLMIEQVMTVEKMYVGGVESLQGEEREKRLAAAYQLGIKMVDEIHTLAGA
jgi:multimeric flavodoxin WrbA